MRPIGAACMRDALIGRDGRIRSVRGRVLAIGDPFAARCSADRADASSRLVVEPATRVDDQPQLVVDGRVHEFLDVSGVEFVELWLVERGGDGLERTVDLGVACPCRRRYPSPARASRMSAGLHRRRRVGFAHGRPGSGRVGMPNRRLIVPFLRQLDRDPLGLGPLGAVGSFGATGAANQDCGQGGPVRLPVLRGRLRSEGVRQGREGDPDRGRSGLADLTRPAVPEGLGVGEARELTDARDAGQVPALRAAPSGST